MRVVETVTITLPNKSGQGKWEEYSTVQYAVIPLQGGTAKPLGNCEPNFTLRVTRWPFLSSVRFVPLGVHPSCPHH